MLFENVVWNIASISSQPQCVKVSSTDTVAQFVSIKIMSWHLKSLAIWLLVQQLVQAYIKENIKGPHYWTFEGNTPVTGGLPSKGPVMQKLFSWHDIVMSNGKKFHKVFNSNYVGHEPNMLMTKKHHHGIIQFSCHKVAFWYHIANINITWCTPQSKYCDTLIGCTTVPTRFIIVSTAMELKNGNFIGNNT